MMASPDTIILLIVDYHAVIGGQDPRGPCLRPVLVPAIPLVHLGKWPLKWRKRASSRSSPYKEGGISRISTAAVA